MQSFFKINFESKEYKSYFSGDFVEEDFFLDSFDIYTLKTLLNKIEGAFWGFCYCGNGTIFIFRDSFGLTPVYYQIINDVFYISSSIASFKNKTLDDVDNSVVIQYLDFGGAEIYTEVTFFKSIKSVIPGHIFTYQKAKNLKTYHCFIKIPILNLDNSNSINLIKTKFLNSINSLLQNKNKFASQLSGGIDSSSIVSVLKRIYNIDVLTIERRTKQERNEERIYSKSVVEELGLNHTIIEEINYDFYEYSKKLIKILEVPQESVLPFASNFGFIDYLKSKDIKYLFSGEWGDDINGSKQLYINSLKKNKHWEKYYFSIKKLSELLNTFSDIKNFFLTFILSQFKKNIQSLNFTGIFIVGKYYLKFSENIIKDFTFFLKLIISKFRIANLTLKSNILNFNVEEIVDSNNSIITNNPQFEAYLKDIFNADAIKVQEERSIIQDNFGVQYLYPFASRDLLDIFANISQELNFQDGYGKGVFRLSMKGILPEIIRTRFNKTSYGNINVEAFKKMVSIFLLEHDDTAIIWRYVDKIKFLKISNSINSLEHFSRQEEQICSKLNRVIYCGIWLKYIFEKESIK